MGPLDESRSVEPQLLHQILSEHETISNMPQELPLVHGHEHSIVLEEGHPSISVCPYHYPHAKKDEIEQLIKEMLAVGIIQVSNSPYSSHVLLVKKKDIS